MSYSTLIVFRADGLAEDHTEFRNSHGSAPRVWDPLVKAHIPPSDPYSSWEDQDKFFQIWQTLPLKDFELDALHWTFDYFVLRREHFCAMADSLEKFDRAHHRQEGWVNHLPAIVEALRKLYTDEPDVQAMAFYHTSVGEDVWQVYEEAEEDEEFENNYRPYDLNKDTKHFFYVPGKGVEDEVQGG